MKKKYNRSTPRMGVQIRDKMYRGPRPSVGDVSIPVMGPLGAVAGGVVGKKLGSWVGSAGRLIGPKHEKYGRQAGEYIYGTLGAGLGAVFTPI
jgi:hypothetical protein